MRLLLILMLIASIYGCTRPATVSNSSPVATPQPPREVLNSTEGNITASPEPPAAVPAGTGNGTAPQATANATPAEAPGNPGPNQTGEPAKAGLPFAGGKYRIVLDDVSTIPTSAEPCGIFSITDQTGSVLEKMLICPPDSETWTDQDGRTFRIRVLKVAAGYSHQVTWAQVIVVG
ncbi:MAG: hypothetical protein U0R44_03005 [Candidatus Micrarchaeia archaeon]